MLRITGYGRGDSPLALIVGDDGLGVREADRAIALAEGTFRGRADWHGAIAGRFDHVGALDLVVAEAQGVADEVLAAALPRIAALRDDADVPVVVALDSGQIDVVAASLFGSRVELLCEPSVADRAAAYAIGLTGLPRDVVHERDGDSESTQLRQLNEEVARISRVLARLSKEESRSRGVGGVADRPLGYTPPTPIAPLTASAASAAEVRRIIRTRRLRDQFFDSGLFEDPAWDMLLDLYAAELEGAQVSVSSLCIAAAVAPTTALRWITRMTEAGLFVREPDPFDRRRAFLRLSADGRTRMDRYFAASRQGGFDTP